jgi:hypothetical protein
MPRADERSERKITSSMPLADQISVLEALISNPPTNSRVVEFTPGLASYILENLSGLNRPFKPANIRRYSADMASGNWGLTGDTIKFGNDGLLKDGYNRLAAEARAKTKFRSHVVFGVDAKLFVKMDIGKNRNGADVLAIKGVTHAGYCAAATRWHTILTGADPTNRALSIPNIDLAKAYDVLDPDKLTESVKAAIAVKRTTRNPVGPLAALHYLFAEVSPTKADTFYREWASGVARSGRAPTRYLQDKLTELMRANNGRMHETVRNALIIKAWNAHYAGRSMSKKDLNFAVGDTFPVIAGAK